MPPPSILDVILRMQGVGQFVAGAKEAAAATGEVGTAAEVSGKKGMLGAKGMLKYAAGAMAIYAAAKFISGAISQTEQYAVATSKLTQQTGLSTEASSEWLAVAQERGISSSQMAMGMTTLSKQMEKARSGDVKSAAAIAEYRKEIDQVAAAGGKTAPAQIAKLSKSIATAQASSEKARLTLQQLGIPLQDIQKGNTPDVLMRVADAFQTMTNPAERAALAQTLFGRSGKALLPILAQGREGVQKMLDAQKEQGHYLTTDQVNANLKAIQQQRELSAAFDGFKTQLSLALLPILIAVGRIFIRIADILRPITSRSWALATVLGALTAAFIAYKAVAIATWVINNKLVLQTILMAARNALAEISVYAMVAALVAQSVATAALTAATWALDAAIGVLTAPITLVILAIIALGVAFYLLYTRVKWFREGVNAALHAVWVAIKYVWDWVRKNWPLLAGALFGPFGLAAAYIITHFSQVKNFVIAVIEAIKSAIQSLLGWVTKIPGKVASAVKHIPGGGTAMKLAGSALGMVGLQHGGLVTGSGGFLVGERGPELVTLPAGALVRPTSAATSVAAGGRDLVIQVPVVLDGKVLARSVARVGANQLARR